jgi:FeS assembly SUF system protein
MTTSAPNAALRDRIIAAMRTVFDPEIPVNIHDLGLIYDFKIEDRDSGAHVNVDMTLTSPNCPVADKLPQQVRDAIAKTPGVAQANVRLVWEPPWSADRMSGLARLELELRGVNLKSPHESVRPRTTGLTVGRTNRRPK